MTSVNDSPGRAVPAVGAVQAGKLSAAVALPAQPANSTSPSRPVPELEQDAAPASAPRFRARKRAGRPRPRARNTGNDAGTAAAAAASDGNAEDDEDGLSHAEIVLLREAQRLRNTARRAHAAPAVTARAAEAAAAAADAVLLAQQAKQEAGGLRSNFAVESSGYDAQRNMEQFVQQRMVEKFGRRDGDAVPTAADSSATERFVSLDDAERELYSIPDHIRVPQREQYDPTEGLPAAGVEEVDIGAGAKRLNAEKTAAAREALLAQREAGRSEDADLIGVVGNVSANFEQHRRDWIETHLGSSSTRNPNALPGARGACNPGADGKGSSKRLAGVATDQAVADRFRKRWRK
jgi:Hepatocellular carcinoma-associated antigen 59